MFGEIKLTKEEIEQKRLELESLHKQALELLKQYNVIAVSINHNDRLGVVGSQVYDGEFEMLDENYDEDGFDDYGYDRNGLDADRNPRSDYERRIDNDYSIRGLWVESAGAKSGWFSSATANC